MDYLDLLYDDLLSQGIAHPDWMLGAMAGALTAFFVQLYYWLGRYGGLPRFRNNRGIRPQIPSPPVSVVVVIRENGYYFIENYLPLLLGQRYDEFEVVAVDCSYDEEIGERVSSSWGGPTPEERMITDQSRARLESLLERMSPRYRKLIELRFFKEYSYEEIAAELQLPMGTVKTQIHRAREQLCRYITESGSR